MEIMKILDYLASIITIVSLYLVTKYSWAWLLYCIGSIFYTLVMIHSKLWGLTGMGIVLFFIGIKNFLKSKR